ncbi:MAG: hypothetical protein LBJ67_03945 [Planctomycetaceae bacterium]|nr:hypothetical protein [Planctomycetaceae bacterium]
MQKTVLVVDEDQERLMKIALYWHDEPWRTITVPTAQEAIDVLDDMPIDMVIVQENMNWISGTEFLKLTCHSYPKMIRVLLTEDAPEKIEWHEARLMPKFHASNRIHHFSPHPCDSEYMTQVVYAMFGMEREEIAY